MSTYDAKMLDGSAQSKDILGNLKDPKVGYARGTILSGEIQEVQRQKHAYTIIKERFKQGGDENVHNLTGLIRGFPLEDDDKPYLPSYIHFISRYDGELESTALRILGGNPSEHDCFLSARVSAGMLATMLTLLKPGAQVLSLVGADVSHPSVFQAVNIAGGSFTEVVGIEAFEEAFEKGARPAAVVITAISPSKQHLPQALTQRAIEVARKHGALVILDDAHMAARLALYDEKPGLALGADVTVWSLDKHMTGPRSGMVSGKKEYIQKIKARALALGVEAQLGQVLAGLRAIKAFNPELIRNAQTMAETLLGPFNEMLGGQAYLAGAGVAVSGERLLQMTIERSGKKSAIVPIEAVAYTAMRYLEICGGVTIPAIGMPGASCTFRLMLYPHGARLGTTAMLEASRTVFTELSDVIDKPDVVRKTLLGH